MPEQLDFETCKRLRDAGYPQDLEGPCLFHYDDKWWGVASTYDDVVSVPHWVDVLDSTWLWEQEWRWGHDNHTYIHTNGRWYAHHPEFGWLEAGSGPDLVRAIVEAMLAVKA